MKKILLLTGASSKLGVPLTQAFLKDGWTVYAGVRDITSSQELNNLQRKNKSLHLIKLDVTSDKDCISSVRKIVKQESKIDCVINNAGVTKSGKTLEFTEEEFKQMFDINCLGAFRISKAVIPFMKKARRGKIVNITSLNGLVSLPYFGVYSSTKFAIEALSAALRAELLAKNIFVTTIAPGAIKMSKETTVQKLTHKPLREKFVLLRFILKMATDIEVCSKVVEIVESETSPSRVVIGRDAKITILLHNMLPSFVWDKLVGFLWRN